MQTPALAHKLLNYSTIILCFYFSFSFGAGASPSDTMVLFSKDSMVSYAPWKHFEHESAPVVFSSDAAVRGEKGTRLTSPNHPKYGVNATLSFMDNFWVRYYFRVDSSGSASHWRDTTPEFRPDFCRLNLQNLWFSEKDGAPITVQLARRVKDDALLMLLLLGGLKGNSSPSINFPILPNHDYCIEYHVSFGTDNNINLEFYLDNNLIGTQTIPYFGERKFIRVFTSNDIVRSIYWQVSLDEMAVTNHRQFSIPARAVPSSTLIDSAADNQISLSCRLTTSSYRNENIQAAEWRLYAAQDSLFPVFRSLDRNPQFFQNRNIRFPLDSGRHWWSVRYQNNFKNWSDWASRSEFRISQRKPASVRVKSIAITDKNGNKPLQGVYPNKWFTVSCTLSSSIPIDSLLYILIWLNDSSNCEGNPSNKGGAFSAASNYPFNMNLNGGHHTFFERNKEGYFTSIRVPQDTMGMYLDNTKNWTVVDRISNTIRIRMKLLSSANPGIWRLSACVVYANGFNNLNEMKEAVSNTGRYRFIVRPIQSQNPFTHWKLFAVILVLASAIFTFIRFLTRKARNEANAKANIANYRKDIEWEKITAYVESHLLSEISVQDALTALKISRKKLYKIMAERNFTFPRYVNWVRIQKAKSLFKEKDIKNLTEISRLVGYDEPKYFFKNFKEIEGMTPTEYLGKNLQNG